MEEKELEALGDETNQAPPETESHRSDKAEGPFSRRQALNVLGGAAVAAVGIGALAIFGLGRDEKKDAVVLSAEITDREAKPVGVAYACSVDDLDGIETCGAGTNNVSSCSPEAAASVAAAQADLPFEVPDQSGEEGGDEGESLEQREEDSAAPEEKAQQREAEESQTTAAPLQADAPDLSADDVETRYLTYRFKDLIPGKPYLFKADIMEPTYAKVEDRASYPKGWRFAKEDSTGAYMIASASKADEASAVVVPSSPSGHVSCALPCAGDGSYALANMTLLGVV